MWLLIDYKTEGDSLKWITPTCVVFRHVGLEYFLFRLLVLVQITTTSAQTDWIYIDGVDVIKAILVSVKKALSCQRNEKT